MKNRTGFSLAEMLIALVAAAVIALGLSTYGSLGVDLFMKFRQKAYILDDLVFSLRMMLNKVRAADSVSKPVTFAHPWIVDTGIYRLDVGSSAAFGVIPEEDATARRFVYCADKSNTAACQLLFRVPSVDVKNYISFTYNCMPNANCTNVRAVKVTLSGKRYNIPFAVSNTIKRRPL